MSILPIRFITNMEITVQNILPPPYLINMEIMEVIILTSHHLIDMHQMRQDCTIGVEIFMELYQLIDMHPESQMNRII